MTEPTVADLAWMSGWPAVRNIKVDSGAADKSRLASFDAMTDSDREAFATLGGPTRVVRRGEFLRHQGDRDSEVYRLREGWLACSVSAPDGSRQIVKIHVPGDLVGMPGLASREAVDTIRAITDAVVETIPLSTFASIFLHRPRLAAMLFIWSQEERVMLMRQLASVGKAQGARRMAGLIASIQHRLQLCADGPKLTFQLPLTQQDLGDATGMSVVHANRSLMELRKRGLVRIEGGVVDIPDLDALRRFAGFTPEQPRRTAWFPGEPTSR